MQAAKRNHPANGKDQHVLVADIRAFEQHRPQLERDHWGEFAVFFQGKLAGVYADFNSAARQAIERFGRGPYLIREIGKAGLGAGTAIHLR